MVDSAAFPACHRRTDDEADHIELADTRSPPRAR